ncbi:MAG TPA: GH25 family lysozyme, partial [Chitinophagales bacterium]|nr:GH25 family lysozyme [Chitinophagales bacterium]
MAKKKQGIPLWLKRSLQLLFALVLIVSIYYNTKYFRRAYHHLIRRYYKTEFKPTDFPEDYEVHGIDISHFQDVVDWNKLWAVDTYGDTIHFGFVYIKATEGMLKEDEMFDDNWDEAKDHKITRGAYHYFLPDRSPELQAQRFISSVKLLPGDLPPAVDVENAMGVSRKVLIERLKIFIQKLESNYHVKPVIYSNVNFIEDYLAEDFKDYPFWISHFYEPELQL